MFTVNKMWNITQSQLMLINIKGGNFLKEIHQGKATSKHSSINIRIGYGLVYIRAEN